MINPLQSSKQAASRWRDLTNLSKFLRPGEGGMRRPDILRLTKERLGLGNTLPKLDAAVAGLPWRPMPELNLQKPIENLYRGAGHVADPYLGRFSSEYVHGTPRPEIAGISGDTVYSGQGMELRPVARFKPVTDQRYYLPNALGSGAPGATFGELREQYVQHASPWSAANLLRRLTGRSAAPSFKIPGLDVYETPITRASHPLQGWSLADSQSHRWASLPDSPQWNGILRNMTAKV